MKYISKGHHNIIHIFVECLQYQIHDNDAIGDYWAQVPDGEYNEICMLDYDALIRLFKAGLINNKKFQQLQPSIHILQLITLRNPSNKTLHFSLYLNISPCGKILIKISFQLLAPRMLRIFSTKLMFHQLLMTLIYS